MPLGIANASLTKVGTTKDIPAPSLLDELSPIVIENDLALIESCLKFGTNYPQLLDVSSKQACRDIARQYSGLSSYERKLSNAIPNNLVNLASFSLQTKVTLTINGKPFISNGHNPIPSGSIIGGKNILLAPEGSKFNIPKGILLYISNQSNSSIKVCASTPTFDNLYSWKIQIKSNDSTGGLRLGLPCQPLN